MGGGWSLGRHDINRLLEQLDLHIAHCTGEVSLHMLGQFTEALNGPLETLFKKSLMEDVPGMWKKANVKPTFKKGDPETALNCRLISQTGVVSKTLEKS